MGVVEELALYVHWPWCVKKCPYCDFNSYACAAIPESEYIDALIAHARDLSSQVSSKKIQSVFIGGGTPSLISEQTFDRLMQALRDTFRFTDDAEITMEANPGTVESVRFRQYAACGVNRFSLGVQSFNDGMLKTLGRIHTAAQARSAIETALNLVAKVNIDLMYALPNQTLAMLEDDIAQAVRFGTQHLSYYELTLEAGSVFYKNPPQGLPESDLAADMGERVHEALTRAGYSHYEISGYAKLGFECRHNRTYWTFGDYLGIGAGAHGKITTEKGVMRTVCASNPALYMKDVREGRFFSESRTVCAKELPFEFMLNALRLTEGVPADRFKQTTGLELDAIDEKLGILRKKGLIEADSSRIVATPLGRRFLSDVLETFLSFGENSE